jgi:hypothetical protein
MVADPEDFTILSLLVPDLDLDPRDLEYLGDDEDSDDDDLAFDPVRDVDTEQLREMMQREAEAEGDYTA